MRHKCLLADVRLVFVRSSRGDGRIIRYAYSEPVYVHMAKISYPGW